MIKYLLPFVFLLPPFASFGQDDPVLYKDFCTGIKSAKSFVFDDHTNITQVNVDDANFDIIAVDDQMQLTWRTSLEGYLLATEKFKGKIVVIASTEYSTFKGSNNTYKAYLIDPVDGKVVVEKVIYTGTEDFKEFPTVFTGDGAYFKLCVRKSAVPRKVQLTFSNLFSGSKYQQLINETRELDVISLNEKLDSAAVLKLPVSNATMITWCGNKQGDLFIAWLNGPSIEVFQYPDGSDKPAKQLNADVAFTMNDNIVPSQHFQLLASSVGNNILYYGVTYKNQNNDAEVGVGKLDFSSGKKLFVKEAFNKDHVNMLEKSFVPVNKKITDADLGRRIEMHLRYLTEANGNLIAAINSRYFESSSVNAGGAWAIENSLLINGYDDNLNTRFQQILPSNFSIPSLSLSFGYHIAKNKLYVLGNQRGRPGVFDGVYGCLDINSGKWDKMEELSKKYIPNAAYISGDAILWFPDSYLAPYFTNKGAAANTRDVILQQNQY